MASNSTLQNRGIVAALSHIAMPFVNSFLCDRSYSEAEARLAAYIQAAKGQGYVDCSDEEYRKGFFLACYYTT